MYAFLKVVMVGLMLIIVFMVFMMFHELQNPFTEKGSFKSLS